MARPRPPAWFYLGTSSFLVYFALIAYSTIYPPTPVGLYVKMQKGAGVVTDTSPGSPADRAGVQAGDRIVAMSGWSMAPATARIARILTTAPDVPQTLSIDRGGRTLELQVVSHGRQLADWTERSLELSLIPVQLCSILLGIFIAARRPEDPFAQLGGLLLCSMGALPLALPRGLAPLWRGLPIWLGVLAWPAAMAALFMPLAFFVFCATFPRRIIPRAVIFALIALWIPIAVWYFRYTFSIVYEPDARAILPDTAVVLASILDFVSLGAGTALLAVGAVRHPDANERRRARVVLIGVATAAIGLLHAVVELLGQSYPTVARVLWPLESVHKAVPAMLAVMPLSFAYAILRHRLFDVSIIIRQGLQYAAARGVLFSIVPIAVVGLAIDLLGHGNQPLLTVLSNNGWRYATVAAIALVAHLQRGRWVAALDRRFFRERYESERLLREVAEDVRRAPGFEAAGGEVAQRIERALHPEFVSLFVRNADAARFSTVVSVPAGHRLVLERDSKLADFVRVLGAPVDVSTGSWMADQLRTGDVEALQREGVDLLVPIVTGRDAREAMLVLGRKKSEEPYSRQDRELLGAVASSLAVLLERGGATKPSLPTLTPRYAVVQRLGEGGMGSVYEAFDGDLHRTVAVKVIRDDALADAAFAQRFRQEALAAAAFAHPNVVSIYDFGVAADGRMFIVMERLTGRTLREEMRTRGRFAPAGAARILSGIAAAADAAHRRQIVHRDLKPENVFLARDGSLESVKVVDFGIARSLAPAAASAVTGTGQIVGTLPYMSPEQLGGAKAGAAADLWAIAVIAYEMVAGAHPFAVEGGFDWPRAVFGRFPPLTGDLAVLNGFFTRAFAAHPDERYADASALAEAFVRLS